MVIEEFAAVVRMDLENWEEQTAQNTTEPILHDQITASQDSYPLAPGGGYIDHLDGMHILTRCSVTTVMDQIDFEVPGLLFLPRNPFHGHIPQQLTQGLVAV